MHSLKRTSAIILSVFLWGVLSGNSRLQAHAQAPEIQPATAEEILADVRGRDAEVTVVNFWATWCVPCREEFPEFIRLGKDLASQGVDVLFVSADFEDALPQAQAFLNEQGVETPSYLKVGKDDAFVSAFHEDWTGALPATILYGPGGDVRAFWEGKTTYNELRSRVEAALGG